MKKNIIFLVAFLPILYLICMFVPAFNPIIVSINGANAGATLLDCLINTDAVLAPIVGVESQGMIGAIVPLMVTMYLACLVGAVLGMILIFASQKTRKRGVKYALNSSICMGGVGLVSLFFYVFSIMQTSDAIGFPVGAIVLVLLAALHIAVIVYHKKLEKAADTRARYMKNIFTPSQKREARNFYIMVIPFFIMVMIMTVFPFVWGVVFSFTNYTGFNLEMVQGTGFSNYLRVFNDPQTFTSLMTTVEIAIFIVPMQLLMGIALAMLLNTNIKGAGFFRTVYYFPSIIPGVGTGIMWRLMFAQNGGVINSALAVFGIDPVNWLGIDHCRDALYIMIAWGSAGGILTYLSALKAISSELYESAAIDGANAWQQFWKITLPMISSTLFYNLVTGIIAAWQTMEQPVFLAGATLLAVPYQPNYTFMVHVYQQIFTNQRFGFGLAMIWVLFAASFILNRLVFWSGNFWVFNENAPDKPKKQKKQKQAAPVAAS